MPILTSQTTNPGTTVTLSAFFLNLASDPTDFVAFEYVTQTQPQTSTGLSVRAMANNRRRAVRTGGVDMSASWALDKVTPAQVAWLEQHVGETMCVRDDVGRKWFGVYTSVQPDEDLYPDRRGEGKFTLSLQQISHSQAV
ncbi:MAG TPA: hypothetical protein VFH56_10900 [Acidimicrobiales bacterium]|nr:hypothetical protein [Acidimicrobiales bacterium]